MTRKKGTMTDNQSETGYADLDTDEAALDAAINGQLAQSVAANPWGEVVEINPKEIAAVRGVTPELEAAAAALAADVTKGIRIRATDENKKSAQIVRKLLSKAGFRCKIREGLFPVGSQDPTDHPVLAMFLTLQAIPRTAEPATETGVNQ